MMQTHSHSRAILLLVLLAVYPLMFGCDANSRYSTAKLEGAFAPSREAQLQADAGASNASTSQPDTTSQPSSGHQRQVIYTAKLRMQVEDVDKSHDSITAFLNRYNAYIESDNRNAYSGWVENTMTLRVERSRFWDLLKAVGRQAVYIDNKDIDAQDVTGAIADMQERLKSKLASEQQYREVLKSAVKIQDILEVQRYLAQIREEIELMQGQLSRVSDQAAYSTITVEMRQKDTGTTPPEDSFWNKAGEAVSGGWDMFISLVLVLLGGWPLWIILALLFSGASRVYKAQKKKSAEKRAAAPQDADKTPDA